VNLVKSPKIEIRRALKSDALSISELIIPLVKDFVSGDYSEQASNIVLNSMAVKRIESNIESSIEYFVAVEEKQIIGVLGIKQENHIYHCFVDQQYHRQGIARSLCRYWLSESRAHKITVNSSKYAVEFYKSLGFGGGKDIFEKNGVICYPMVLLKTPPNIQS